MNYPCNSTILLEVIGVAGAGKSTMAEALLRHIPQLNLGGRPPNRIVGLRATSIMVRTLQSYVAVNARHWRGPKLSWLDAKDCAYLDQFSRFVQRPSASDGEATLFDQGPLYRLARLYAHRDTSSTPTANPSWWAQVLEHWSKQLDLVISLDAPDEVLIQRVQTRPKNHIIKQRTAQEASCFVSDFRTRFEGILSSLQNYSDTQVMRFDTSRDTIERMVEFVASQFDSLRQDRQPQRHAA